MKIKTFIIKLFLSFFIIFKSFSTEVIFESSNMDVKNNGNFVIAYDVKVEIPNDKLSIKSKKASYDKITDIIIFEDNVDYKDYGNNIKIKSNKITYNRNTNIIYSAGKVILVIENKYKIKSDDLFYNREVNSIYSESKTIIEDNYQNIYNLSDNFYFDTINEIIKSGKSEIVDKYQNRYLFEDLQLNLVNNEIAGKEIKVEFNDGYFGNRNNDPILKGRSSYSNEEELKVYKAVFSTCNIENKKCRGWELSTNEFVHDKKKKIFEYKNSWLSIFDHKIFYLPYFNHPDPTVKRRSGFLTPSYSASKSLGTSINLPYFKVLDIDKDMTFNPRYYADKSFLLQNEYRQIFEKSKFISDVSFLVGNEGTKGHIFLNQIGKFNEKLNFEINLQNIEGDNYLKKHNLNETSLLIKDNNLLLSNLDLNWNLTDAKLNTSFKVFEDLSRGHRDRYQYIFPEFNFTKNLKVPQNYNGRFNFYSYGYNKNYNTNINETILTNDFLYSSNQFINNKGLISNYDLLLKNTNSYSNNSSTFKENSNYDLFGTLKIDTSLPLQKRMQNFNHYLTPKISFRYSPNKNRNISSKDILLNYNNVFALNRIGTDHEVEGGESLSLGLEFKRENIENFKIFDFKLANVIRLEENKQLPKKSKLNKTRSDIFGSLVYNFNKNLNFGYFFSYDRDLEYSNLEQLNIEYSVNNFYNSFSYYTEDNDLGNKENVKNYTSYNFDQENKFGFEMTKDLKDDFTQYYNLIYTYQTDCISFNLNYNKTFYRDGNLEPNRSLSFLVRIIPFSELGVTNIGNFVSN